MCLSAVRLSEAVAPALQKQWNGKDMPNINKYGFKKPERYVYKSQKGLNSEVVEEITKRKNEPAWMSEFRFKSDRKSVV